MLAVSQLQLNQKVSIVHIGNWGAVTYTGKYTVSRVSPSKVTLSRDLDGYERFFSVKRNCEMVSDDGKLVDKNTFIEAVEESESRILLGQRRNVVNALWREVIISAEHKEIAKLEEMVFKLKVMLSGDA